MGEKSTTLLLCFAASAALASPAMAQGTVQDLVQNRLTMPFACSMAGGTVSLAPSAPRSYRIYGPFERKRLTTCSPHDPGNCHNWFVYRFDLDCGGRRASWQSVVAALSVMFADAPGTRAHPDRMPPWAARRTARQYGPGAGVDFPPGFAPNPLRVAKFEETRPERTSPEETRPELTEAAPARVPLPPKKPVLETPASTETAAAAPRAAPATEAGEKTDAAREADGKTTPPEPASEKPTEIALASKSGGSTGSLPGSASDTLWRDAGLVFVGTLAVLLALTALLLFRRGRGMETMPVPFVAVPLKRTMESLFTRKRTIWSRNAEARQSDDPETQSPATGLRLWDEDWLPATRSEAVDVLGVDPGASEEAMKTTVTRLRRALHPDHAFDDEDRALRERRLKQINVAWDIVSGKRRAS